NSVVTDVDIAFVGQHQLFIGQCKVILEPDSAYERWKGKKRLATAADQLDICMEEVSQIKQEFSKRSLGSKLRDDLEVIPFILTNTLYYTGARIRNYTIIDF